MPNGKQQKRLPSQEKPWMRCFDGMTLPSEKSLEQSLNSFIWNANKDRMHLSAISYFGNTITFAQMKANVQQTARALANAGVKEGDIVTVCTVMIPETMYLFYAMDLLGVIPNMIDPRTSTAGVHDYIAEVHSKLVVTINLAYPRIQAAIENTECEKVLVLSPADSLSGLIKLGYRLKNPDKNNYDSKAIQWNTFFKAGKTGADYPMDNYDPARPSLLVHTGGTTGIPKGVMLGAKNINALAAQYGINGFEAGQRFLNVMPPFIAYGFCCGVHVPLSQGVSTIPVPALDPDELAGLILKHKPNHMAGAPLHYLVLARDKRLEKADLSFFVTAGMGGDFISEEGEKEVNAFLKAHNVRYPLAKGYGLSEVCSTITTCMGDNYKLGSIGYPLCLSTVAIFEPGTDHELGYNEEGELCFISPNVMLGYYENEKENKLALRQHSDGKVWLHSGDIGVMDEDGYIFLRSRIKRVIVRHDGFKIYCTTVENGASRHPWVDTCSAVGVKDVNHLQGDLPVLFVVWKEGAPADKKKLEQELKEVCERELPEYTLPLAYVTKEALPYTGISKVDYRKLEEEAKAVIGIS